jgi:hypothetical protein
MYTILPSNISNLGQVFISWIRQAVYMKKAEIDVAMPLSVQTLDAVGYYLMPDYQLSPIALPERVKRLLGLKRLLIAS